MCLRDDSTNFFRYQISSHVIFRFWLIDDFSELDSINYANVDRPRYDWNWKLIGFEPILVSNHKCKALSQTPFLSLSFAFFGSFL